MPSASIRPQPGEVWYVDLGIVTKGRPVLILSYPEPDDARALAVVAPLTSSIRDARGEVDLGPVKWLPKRSAVNVQGLASFDRHKLEKKLGRLSADQMAAVKRALREILEL